LVGKPEVPDRHPYSLQVSLQVRTHLRQAKLRRARVAVVGAGGGGRHVIQQLAYLGVGEILVIDPDVYEESGRPRIVLAIQSDLGKPKVKIFERFVRKIGLGTRIQSIRAAIPDADAVRAVWECDVIVGCVDTLFSRSDLQEIASRYLIPYVDIGATVRDVPDAESSDPRVQVAGNVFTFVPGSFCLWCCNFLSRQKIESEQNGPTRTYFEKNKQEAQVVSFNGVLASQAVSEVLQLLTGYRGSGIREADLKVPGESAFRGYKKFDGVTGTLQEWGGARRLGCEHCEHTLAAGDMIFTKAFGLNGAALTFAFWTGNRPSRRTVGQSKHRGIAGLLGQSACWMCAGGRDSLCPRARLLDHLHQHLSSFCRIAYFSQKCDTDATQAVLGPQSHMKPEAIDRDHSCFLRLDASKFPGKQNERVLVVSVHVLNDFGR
jgi:hypothetical protein